MSFFISEAIAEAAPAAGAQQDPVFPFIMLIGMLVIFYLFLWRPQNKRAKEHRQLLETLSKGDEVVTNGGLMGKVVKVEEGFVVVNIAENVDIKLQKSAVVSTLPKGTLKAI